MASRKKKKQPEQVIVDAPEEGEGKGGRSFWSGTISFGLVTVPVEMYAAQRSERTSLRTLARDGTPLSRRYYRASGHDEVGYDGIERGYELDDGRMVPLTDDELERLLPEKSRDIDLRAFVDADKIDPRYLDRAYFLLPTGGNTLAYRLLATAMERSGKVGIATFVMRAKAYVIAIESDDGLLRAQTLRFADELRTPDDVGLPEKPAVSRESVQKLKKAITGLKKRELALSELDDPYWESLTALVEKKRKKHEGVVAPQEVPEEEAQGAEVIDLLEVLKRSLRSNEEGKAATGKKPRARAHKGQRRAG